MTNLFGLLNIVKIYGDTDYIYFERYEWSFTPTK